MTSTAPIKPADITAAPESEFERGVREGAHNALAYFRDENGFSTIDEESGDSLDRIEAQSVAETLRDEASTNLPTQVVEVPVALVDELRELTRSPYAGESRKPGTWIPDRNSAGMVRAWLERVDTDRQ